MLQIEIEAGERFFCLDLYIWGLFWGLAVAVLTSKNDKIEHTAYLRV